MDTVTFYQGFICGAGFGAVFGIIVLSAIIAYLSKAPVDDEGEWG